jgi:hypothetical protein
MASWSGFWHGLASVLTKAAIYAAGHPDVVIAIANDVKAAG